MIRFIKTKVDYAGEILEKEVKDGDSVTLVKSHPSANAIKKWSDDELAQFGLERYTPEVPEVVVSPEQLIGQLFEMSVATVQAVASTEVQLFLANQVFSGSATPEQKQRHGILTALSSACANYYDVTKAEILAGTRTCLLYTSPSPRDS